MAQLAQLAQLAQSSCVGIPEIYKNVMRQLHALILASSCLCQSASSAFTWGIPVISP